MQSPRIPSQKLLIIAHVTTWVPSACYFFVGIVWLYAAGAIRGFSWYFVLQIVIYVGVALIIQRVLQAKRLAGDAVGYRKRAHTFITIGIGINALYSLSFLQAFFIR